MNGILLLGQDELIESRARRHGVHLERGVSPELRFEKTLITVPGARVPWELLPAAWKILDHWDAAVPLFEYTVTAESAGTAEERAATQAIVRDLRVLLYAHELLFVRKNVAGEELVRTWLAEMRPGGEKRLAFLRALYQVKPRLCVLPTTWLLEVRERQPARGRTVARPQRVTVRRPPPASRRTPPLVLVEIAPGRMIKCRPGDEQAVREQMAQMNARRPIMAVVSRKSFVQENQKTRANKGPLVRVELQPGRYVKMYEADAIAAGHIRPRPEPKQKARPPQENKIREPGGDKGAETAVTPPAGAPAGTAEKMVETAVSEPDDFTTIDGIGRATARLLAAHDITTFEELRQADLGFLSGKQREVIEEWRSG